MTMTKQETEAIVAKLKGMRDGTVTSFNDIIERVEKAGADTEESKEEKKATGDDGTGGKDTTTST